MATWTEVLPRRTLLNGAAVFGGEAFSRLATFAMAVIVARRFGALALGQYGYALALASVLMIVPDFGLHLFATRELASEPGRLRRIFWCLHWLKFLLAASVAAFTLLFGEWVVADAGRRMLLYVLVARALLQTFSQAYMAIFKAFERMEYIALQQFVNAVLAVTCAALALAFEAHLATVVAAFLVGQAVETWLGWLIVRRRFGPGEIYTWDGAFLREMLCAAAPIGLTAILQALNLRLDVLTLSAFVSNRELGHFQAAAWFAMGTYLFASLLMAVLFPKLSRLLREPSSRGSVYVESLLKHGVILASAGALVAWVGARPALTLLFGPDFAPAAELLRRLAPVLPFLFLNTVLFYVFVAARRRAVYLGVLAFGVAAGGGMNALLAWHYGATGSALADLIREFLMTLAFLYFLCREKLARTTGAALLKVSLATACAALLAGMATQALAAGTAWTATWNLLMLAGTLAFLGAPNSKELLMLADETI